jgi:hypothetical protein
MPPRHQDPRFLANLAVVVVCLLSTSVAMGSQLIHPPSESSATGTVTVQSASWEFGWAPGYYSYTLHLGPLVGNCSWFNGTYRVGTTPWCYFVNDGYDQLGGSNDSVNYHVWARSVIVQPPFSELYGLQHGVLTCICDSYGITLRMPSTPGIYNLTGQVYFGWSS